MKARNQTIRNVSLFEGALSQLNDEPQYQGFRYKSTMKSLRRIFCVSTSAAITKAIDTMVGMIVTVKNQITMVGIRYS